ncbi:MAG TPA: phosphoglycolate phosphatase [Spirochaetaceae bacterium]|nr:phosphoglycolate phosphatase [Spirochaetaceae bacterium]HAW86505.1 phosphoglycolate phosphatase [Spirochaetaceae bacterium]HAX37456.1 phosphoglycolate phosphatase [Spirochaetaceae bacterium]HBO41602.1 phosphoglycolate phosphatase [Spirochaetaceae bacterium]HCQ87862.1 phosphoglycolate phosphatase [Spirochaetaceae bacterium]
MKACIFDLDGTLVDTLADIAAFVNPILLEHGWPEHPLPDYRYLVGRGFRALLKAAIPADAVVDFEQLYLQSLERYKATGVASSQPYPGVGQVLAGLEQRRLALAVVTNKPDLIAKAVVAQTFPANRFVLVRGAIDGRPIKPDPAGALAAAAAAGVCASECAFIGDSDVDMLTARAAGMVALGAAWGFRSAAELLAAGSQAILEDIRDLPAWLDQQA